MFAIKRVCVFAGSSPGGRPVYAEAAAALGRLLATERLGVVYGGAAVGCMGALADAALSGGAEVIGVIPRGLATREVAHKGLHALHVVSTMHERKAMMAELSDAFIALPGGLGTLEELAEISTWAMLGIHGKPLGLLDVANYWRPLVAALDHAVAEGFLRPEHRELVLIDDAAASLLARFRSFVPTARPRWLDRSET